MYAQNLTENYSHVQPFASPQFPVCIVPRTIRYTFINITYAVYNSMAAKEGVKREAAAVEQVVSRVRGGMAYKILKYIKGVTLHGGRGKYANSIVNSMYLL